MSYLRMVEDKLPPGFRFHPRDDELICDYLTPKIIQVMSGDDHHGDASQDMSMCSMMMEVDLNKCEPWDLPEVASVGSKDWYFFNMLDRKYATGQRTNRATTSGYWKATGKDRPVSRMGTLVGMRKTLVFYQGRAPKGKKTDWVMHEFRLEGQTTPDSMTAHSKFPLKEDWVLCRVFDKSRAVGMTSKLTSRESSYTDTTGSSSLQPLTTTYNDFDQTFAPPPPPPPNVIGGNFTATTPLEQVPCFSNYPQNYTTLMERNNNKSFNLPSSCDTKVLNSVIDHFNKVEGNHQQQLKSYLSDSALSSSVWYPFQS